jgi:hypothetical protein
MVTVKYQGRLGNNLFQYCFGRIIAEQLGFSLACEGLDGFRGTFHKISGQTWDSPKEVITDKNIDFEAIIDSKNRHRNIVLEGFFQNYQYYYPLKDQIRKWLSLELTLPISPSSNDLVVNVRRTDYVELGWALPFSYYETAILHSNASNIYIVTDDSFDPFFLRFRKFNAQFVRLSPIAQIHFMNKFESIVMSQSSFSWWGAFLGIAANIYCPIPLTGIWAVSPNNPTRLIPDGNEMIKIPCAENYTPNKIELIYNYLRKRQREIRDKIYYRINK